jgi:hypothetical protein
MFRFVYVIKITNFNPTSPPSSSPHVRLLPHAHLFLTISVFLHFLFLTQLARHHRALEEPQLQFTAS